MRKHRDIKLVTTNKRRYRLVSEPNYHTTKWFSENLLAIEMKKTNVKMNKSIYLGLMHVKTEGLYKDIANDVEKGFDTSNYEVNRLLPTGKNKKVIGLMKDELGGKIMTEFVALKPKTYSYLTDDCEEDKKAKGTKKCIIKRRLKFSDYKDCLLNNEIMLKSQERFKNERHDV